MNANDFGDNSFPSIWSAINAENGRGEVEVVTRSFMRFESDFSFDTTFSAYDGTIF